MEVWAAANLGKLCGATGLIIALVYLWVVMKFRAVEERMTQNKISQAEICNMRHESFDRRMEQNSSEHSVIFSKLDDLLKLFAINPK